MPGHDDPTRTMYDAIIPAELKDKLPPLPSEGGAMMNTDRELWREREGDYYADSVSVTDQGAICLNVGGLVFCKSIRDWHALAKLPSPAPSQASGVTIEPAKLSSYDPAKPWTWYPPCKWCGGVIHWCKDGIWKHVAEYGAAFFVECGDEQGRVADPAQPESVSVEGEKEEPETPFFRYCAQELRGIGHCHFGWGHKGKHSWELNTLPDTNQPSPVAEQTADYLLGRCIPLLHILIHEGSSETKKLAKAVNEEIIAYSRAQSASPSPQEMQKAWDELLAAAQEHVLDGNHRGPKSLRLRTAVEAVWAAKEGSK